jgi:hypothetical protein
MAIAIAAFTQIKIILQVRIGLGNVDDVLKCRRMEGRSPQVGMNHHAGCIDNPAESRLDLKVDLFLEEGKETLEGDEGIFELGEVFFMEEFFPKISQPLSDGLHHDSSGVDFQEVRDLRP